MLRQGAFAFIGMTLLMGKTQGRGKTSETRGDPSVGKCPAVNIVVVTGRAPRAWHSSESGAGGEMNAKASGSSTFRLLRSAC